MPRRFLPPRFADFPAAAADADAISRFRFRRFFASLRHAARLSFDALIHVMLCHADYFMLTLFSSFSYAPITPFFFFYFFRRRHFLSIFCFFDAATLFSPCHAALMLLPLLLFARFISCQRQLLRR